MSLEKITQRWIEEEGFSPSSARDAALDEIDFYQEEAQAWKGNDDRIQEFI